MTSASPRTEAPCGAIGSPYPRAPFAFRAVQVPLGADACYDAGTFGAPQPFDVTNYGSLVAYSGRDFDHQRDIWYGDLAAGTVKLAYQAPEDAGTKVEIWYLRMVPGALVWLERLHAGRSVADPLKEWSIKRLDLGSQQVSTVMHEPGLPYGGSKVVDPMRFDGKRFALGEGIGDQKWQIEIIDTSDNSRTIVPVERALYDVALVSDGVLFTTGENLLERQTIGNMRTYLWTKNGGSRLIGLGDFMVAADGDLMAWIEDKTCSELFNGRPASPQALAAILPATDGTPLSKLPYGKPTVGINFITVGSGTVAWWEDEWTGAGGQFTLTLWQPGWKEPIQLDTPGNSPNVSVNGGWLVWFEYDEQLNGRLRGVPLAALIAAAGAL